SEEHTSELQSQSNLVCRLLLEKKILGRLHVKLAKEFSQCLWVRRRHSNEVVMIGEYCPGAQVPAKFAGALEQGLLKKIQPQRRIEMRQFPISACGYNVKARFKEPVRRPMRPIHR